MMQKIKDWLESKSVWIDALLILLLSVNIYVDLFA